MRGTISYGIEQDEMLYMSNIVNVRALGAVGDGVINDARAIQKAFDFLKNSGGTILFPVGTYLITSQVFFYSNQKIVFEKGAKLLQGYAMDNLMMNYSTSTTGAYDATENVEIVGGIFDGGSYTTNNTLLGVCHAKNIKITDCTFVNAYGSWHNLEINACKNVTIDGCRFEGSRKTSSNGCLIQIDNFTSTATWPWGNGLVDNTVSQLVEIRACHFYDSPQAPAIGNHSPAISNAIRIHDNVFENVTTTRGAINFVNATNVDVYNNTFIDCATGVIVGTADGTNLVHNNRFVGVSTVADESCNADSNMVNGTLVTDDNYVTDDDLKSLAYKDVISESDLDESLLEKLNSAGGASVQADWNETDESSDAFIMNKPEIPDTDTFATKDYVQEQLSGVSAPDMTGYAKSEDIPTKVSELENDAGYLTEQIQADWDETDATSPAYIKNKPTISGSGGEAVQPDWEQSDESAADFIKNKPFGDYGVVLTELLPGTTVPFNYSEGNGTYIFQMTPSSEYLETWYGDWTDSEIVWDGTTYACQAQYLEGIKVVGNIGLMMGTEGTGEPFIIMMADAATFGENICLIYSLTDEIPTDTSTAETKYHNISVSIYLPNIVKLPLKYSHRPDWNESDSSNGSYIANRPFFTMSYGTVVVPETTVSCDSAISDTLYYALTPPINIGAFQYQIEFDGVACEVTGGDNGDGTYLLVYSDDSIAFQISSQGVLLSTQGSHTFKITLLEDAVFKIDEKYLPEIKALPEVTTDDDEKILSVVDGVWGVAEHDWSTLKNKPFYEETYSASCSFATAASMPTVKFTVANMTAYKVADFALTQEQLLQSTFTFNVDESTYEFPITTGHIDVTTDDFALLAVDDFQFIVAYRAGSLTYSGLTFRVPKVGIYMCFPTSFTLPAPIDTNILCNYVKTLDAKFIPEIDSLPEVTTDDDGKTLVVSDGAWAVESGLPKITTDDNDKVLKVVDGAWAVSNVLPVVTSEDAGKFLRVSADGLWAAETILNAEEVGF